LSFLQEFSSDIDLSPFHYLWQLPVCINCNKV
jgi:hypothetical protein